MSDCRSVLTKGRSNGRKDRLHSRRKGNVSISPECGSRKGCVNTVCTLVYIVRNKVRQQVCTSTITMGTEKQKV